MDVMDPLRDKLLLDGLRALKARRPAPSLGDKQ